MSRRPDSMVFRRAGLFAGAALAAASPAAGAAPMGAVLLDRVDWAWWALLAALVALAAVFGFLRTVGYRRLNRLGQCVVVSVLAHVALTAGMSLVAISQPVFALLTRHDPDRASVNLVVGHEAQLRTQIRYQVTELPVADPSLATLMRAALEAIQTPRPELTELSAPLSEPRRTELTAESESPLTAPPAVTERVLLRPPPEQVRKPVAVESPYRPVARTEPHAQAAAERPVRLPAVVPRTADPAAWRAASVSAPATKRAGRSIATAAARETSPLPSAPDAAVPVRQPTDAPSVEIPQPTAPVRGPDHQPAPIEPTPRRLPGSRMPDRVAGQDRPTELTAARRVPPAEPTIRSIAVAAATAGPVRPETPPSPRPVRASADRPAVELSSPAPPVRAEDPHPGASDVSAASLLARRHPGAPSPRSSPASLASPQRVPPADPLGASLSGHLAVALLPPVADDLVLERVRLKAALVPLDALKPQKLKVVKPIEHRTPERRKELVRKMGGSRISEAAVTRALAYLAQNQEPDGRWTYVGEETEQAGKRPANKDDTGLTGLAVLCFLAADERPDKACPYRKNVRDGLAYLLARQKADGDLRGAGDMYSHGIATLALGEAAVMTADPKYGQPAVKGARFILAAQNRFTGGWRYVPRSGGDTSVMGWQIMALYSVSRLGIEIPLETRRGAMRWLTRVSRGRQGMLVGYQDANPTRTMTAEGLFVRLLLGQKLTAAQIAEVDAYLKPPNPMEPPNFYSWYYGSLALMQLQDEAWRKWNANVRDRLTSAQERGGKLDGSWDPSQSRWGGERGGRVYTTAVGTLTLEVYYRYLPMLGRKGSGKKPAKP